MDFIPHISQDTANSADTNSDVDISVNEPIVCEQSENRLVREPSAYRLYADRSKTNLISQDPATKFCLKQAKDLSQSSMPSVHEPINRSFTRA